MDQIFDTESAGSYSAPLGTGMSWKEKTNNSEKASDQTSQIPFHPLKENTELKTSEFESIKVSDIRGDNDNKEFDNIKDSTFGAKEDYLMVNTYEIDGDIDRRKGMKEGKEGERIGQGVELESTINPMMVNVYVDDQNDDDSNDNNQNNFHDNDITKIIVSSGHVHGNNDNCNNDNYCNIKDNYGNDREYSNGHINHNYGKSIKGISHIINDNEKDKNFRKSIQLSKDFHSNTRRRCIAMLLYFHFSFLSDNISSLFGCECWLRKMMKKKLNFEVQKEIFDAW